MVYRGDLGTEACLGHPEDHQISSTPHSLRSAFVVLEAGSIAEGPPRRRIFKNRYVSQSYLQGKSKTLCPEGVVKGVVKQKERKWELGSQKVIMADLSKMAVWFTYHLFKNILINEFMYLCSVSSHDYQWFLVGPFQIRPITETQNLRDE